MADGLTNEQLDDAIMAILSGGAATADEVAGPLRGSVGFYHDLTIRRVSARIRSLCARGYTVKIGVHYRTKEPEYKINYDYPTRED